MSTFVAVAITATNAQSPATAQSVPTATEQVLINGSHFVLGGKLAFIMEPREAKTTATIKSGRPWIFYAPTLMKYPDQVEREMHQQFIDAGIAIAGIDVGEAYGSPLAYPHFESLHQEMVKRGYSAKPILLGRSRGGLWVSSWAIKHPERVRAIACIYPVFDFTSYPTAKRAAPAYGISEEKLLSQEDQLNPIRRCNVLAKLRIPIFIIHGEDDKVVPIRENSGKLAEVYSQHDAANHITLLRINEQGHSLWPGYFHCKELIRFVVGHGVGVDSGTFGTPCAGE